MSLHNIEFEYMVDGEDHEGFLPNVEIDEELDLDAQEMSCVFEIKNLFPDATDIRITNMEPV